MWCCGRRRARVMDDVAPGRVSGYFCISPGRATEQGIFMAQSVTEEETQWRI